MLSTILWPKLAILNLPTTDEYAVRIDKLVKSFADSAEKKLRKLLNEDDIDDHHPS